MKNLTTKLMITAAALVAAANVASAQTMEAKIPFAFRADGTVLAAGTYRVTVQHAMSGPVVIIEGAKPGQHLISLAVPNGEAKEAWKSAGDAVLSFRCGVSRCVLTDMWIGAGAPTYKLPTPSLGKDEPVHTAEIPMHMVKGD